MLDQLYLLYVLERAAAVPPASTPVSISGVESPIPTIAQSFMLES